MDDRFGRHRVVAALPMFKAHVGGYVIDHTIVVVTDDGGEWITGIVSALTDREWFWGHYFSTPEAAMADAYKRAGLTVGSL